MQISHPVVTAVLTFAMPVVMPYQIHAGFQADAPAVPSPKLDDDTQIPIVSKAARPIVDRFNSYYRSLQEISCSAEIELTLQGKALDDRIFMRARAVRPNKVEVLAFDEIGAFPTSQFTSNGTDLYEFSIKRNSYMISKAAAEFSALHERALNRSAPNLPVEIFLALLSERPMENLLKMSVEPGVIRLVGTDEIEGTRCHALVLNAKGSRAWVAADGAPRLMRYMNSPVVAKPRYLPPNAIVRGLDAIVTFKSWVDQDTSPDWSWTIPRSAKQMATMHENAAGPGPEQGYSSMQLEDSVTPDGGETPTLTRNRLQRADDLDSEALSGLKAGTPAPDVTLERLDGSTLSLHELRDGRPAILLFWIPGGKFSQSGMGKVIEAARGYSDQVEVVPIAVGGSTDSVRAFVEQFPAFSDSYLDAGVSDAMAFEVGRQAGIVLVTDEGNVWRSLVGPRPNLDVRLDSYLKAMFARNRGDSTTKSESPTAGAQDQDGPAQGTDTSES